MKVKTKRRLVIVLILMSSVAVMYGLKTMRPESQKKPVKETAMLIDVLKLKSAPVTFKITSQGTVKPRTETILSAEVSGRIISISDKFIPGGIFYTNEVLMEIDPTDYEVAVAQSKALLKQRQIEFDGAKSLRKKGYRAEAEMAAADTALQTAKAALVKATKNLQRTKIRLPYDGMVKAKGSDIGQFVNPGSRLGTTFAVDKAEVRLALTDQDLAFLRLPEASDSAKNIATNEPAVILSATRKGKYQQWKARIVRTEGVIDEKSRVTYAVAQIDDPYRLNIEGDEDINVTPLLVGTFVKAVIEGSSYSNVIKVPRTSIRGKNELLFVDSNNQLDIRQVNILRADTEHAYILEDAIQTGERISITAIESPINGMKVRTSDDPSVDEKLTDSENDSVSDSQSVQSN